MFTNSQLDIDFQKALSHFDGTISSPYYNKLFLLLKEGAKRNVTKMLRKRGIKGKDIDSYSTDVVIKILPRFLKKLQAGVPIESGPVALTYFASFNVLFNNKEKNIDKELSFEGDMINAIEGDIDTL